MQYGGLTFGNSATATMTSFGHPELAIWMPNTYAIMSAVCQGLLGACSDKIGRKPILLGGFVLACIGNITVAAAPNPGAVLFGQFFWRCRAVRRRKPRQGAQPSRERRRAARVLACPAIARPAHTRAATAATVGRSCPLQLTLLRGRPI